MGKDNVKFQLFLCLSAGIGMFLPLYYVSYGGKSESISFFNLFNSYDLIKETNFIHSYIALAVLVVAFILLFFRLGKDNYFLKIISLLCIIATGILYYINIDKASIIKILASINYGLGHYITLFGIIIAVILGFVDLLFNRGNRYVEQSYININKVNDNAYKYNVNPALNNPLANSKETTPLNEQQSSNPQSEEKQPSESHMTSSIKLSDIIKQNSVVNQQNNNDNSSNDLNNKN